MAVYCLKSTSFATPLGPMAAVADEEALYLLAFIGGQDDLGRAVAALGKQCEAAVTPGKTTITQKIQSELEDYFSGNLLAFRTKMGLIGSSFQKKVWGELSRIPFGETRSYLGLAQSIHLPTGPRAVARANATNRLAIIVPCHRVIYADGSLGGYSSGIARKEWLLQHEEKYKK